MSFATTIHQVKAKCKEGSFSLFAGRRTPHPDFHLLQHMYICEQLGGMATSSLFAGRVLSQTTPPCKQQLIGTLAHEGPMGFMGLHPELDAGGLPLSSLLWHLLFWVFCKNNTILHLHGESSPGLAIAGLSSSRGLSSDRPGLACVRAAAASLRALPLRFHGRRGRAALAHGGQPLT